MCIEHNTKDPSKRFSARFKFAFEKGSKGVRIQAVRFTCALPSEKMEEHLISCHDPTPLPDFSCDDLLQAHKSIAGVWSILPIELVIVEYIPSLDVSVEWRKSPSSFDEKTRKKLVLCCAKLKIKAFLEGIFGKKVLDIFEYECSSNIYTPGLWMGYVIVPLYKQQPACEHVDELDIRLWVTNAYKPLGNNEIFKGRPRELYRQCLNIISDLHFTLDIEKNEIRDAKFLGNLKLNGRVFMNNGHYHDSRPIEKRGTMADD